MLTIAYITARVRPHTPWFFWSLRRELERTPTEIRLIIVDLHAEKRDISVAKEILPMVNKIYWIEPKPTVWQGRYARAVQPFFAAANARNTAIALAPDGYIAFIDDLSVLLPGWLVQVHKAIEGKYIVCGSFQKVKKLLVEKGEPVSFEEYKEGSDSRWACGDDKEAVCCHSLWFFGCSLAAPVEAFLKINGYPEALCDSMGYEDCVTGEVIARHGYIFRYSRAMKTLESEDDHHNQPATLRFDPGNSPEDKSHALVEKAKGIRGFSQSMIDDGQMSLRQLRERMLSGGKFPIRKKPTHEWYTGIPVEEFHKYPEFKRKV